MLHTKKSGKWGKAINLGPLVNTPFNEESPEFTMIVYFTFHPMDADMGRRIFLPVK